VSRKTDLEHHISESYDLIRQYEAIVQTSSDPKEKARSKRAIDEQWGLIEGYLAEYRRLAGEAWPADIAEIAARFTPKGSPLKGTTLASVRGLELTMYNSSRNDLTNRLNLSIPPKDPDHPLKATSVTFQLYLLNNSDKMARYIQIEMFVKAHFLSYSYETEPLIVEPGDKWEIGRAGDDTFRCFFEGGADLVCHIGKPRDLGVMAIQVPCGEADGGAITMNIPYSITAEEHKGGGLLIVWLQAITDWRT
jgi:hypothetical protein